MKKIKKHIRKWLINWLFERPISKYAKSQIKDKDEDFANYLSDLLYKDETRMVMSREGLNGYHDLDIEMNRILQREIKEYVRD